jgi:hypothetical protein
MARDTADPARPVWSGLSRRRRGPAHYDGILTAYKLPKFREKRNHWRSCALSLGPMPALPRRIIARATLA